MEKETRKSSSTFWRLVQLPAVRIPWANKSPTLFLSWFKFDFFFLWLATKCTLTCTDYYYWFGCCQWKTLKRGISLYEERWRSSEDPSIQSWEVSCLLPVISQDSKHTPTGLSRTLNNVIVTWNDTATIEYFLLLHKGAKKRHANFSPCRSIWKQRGKNSELWKTKPFRQEIQSCDWEECWLLFRWSGASSWVSFKRLVLLKTPQALGRGCRPVRQPPDPSNGGWLIGMLWKSMS